MEDLAKGGQRVANYTVEFLPADAADDDDAAWRTLVPTCAVFANGTVACDGGERGALGDRPDGHDPRDQYIGHKRIDVPVVNTTAIRMAQVRFNCLRLIEAVPAGEPVFLRSFSLHKRRVPWEQNDDILSL